MALSDATPTIIAARMLRYLSESGVYSARVNRSYETEAVTGDKVALVKSGSVSIGDYVAGGDALEWPRYAPGDDVEVTLNKNKFFNIRVEDIDERQSRPSLMQNAIEVGGAKLVDAVDADVRDVMLGVTGHGRDIGAKAEASAAVDFSAALTADIQRATHDAFRAARRAMIAAKVPGPHWAIVGDVGWLLLSTVFSQPSVAGEAISEEVQRNGWIGRLYGLDVYVSSNSKKIAAVSGTSHAGERLVFGTDFACVHIQQINRVERIRLQNYFADGYRGLLTYGTAIAESEGLFECDLWYANLPAFA